MRFSVVFTIAAAVASTSASLISRQGAPDCAINCILNADLGGCAQNDNACLCKNQAFVSSTTSCIQTNCSGSDLQAAEQFAQATCASVGVTLTSSSAASTPTTPASGSTSSSTTSQTPTTTANAAYINTASTFVGVCAFGVAALML